MDFRLTEEHTFIQNTVRAFLSRECPREKAHALDKSGTTPADLLRKIAEMGFCGLNVPESFGGGGQDMLGASLVAEALAAVSPPLAALYAGVTFTAGAVLSRLASDEQKARFLPKAAAGTLAASALLAGPEADQTVTAERTPDGFLLAGQAPFALLPEPGGLLIVQARHDDASTCFLVPAAAPGLQITPLETVGMRGTRAAAVTFADALVSPADVLGGPEAAGKGAVQAETITAIVRLATAAIALGLALGALDYAAAYAGERVQFGRPIARFEAVLHMLVDETVGLCAARWLLYHACWLADQGELFALEAAMACLQTVELARQAGLQGVHILGGYGYMAEYDAARYMRDSLVLFNGGEPAPLLKTAIGDLAGLREDSE